MHPSVYPRPVAWPVLSGRTAGTGGPGHRDDIDRGDRNDGVGRCGPVPGCRQVGMAGR